MLGLGTLLVVLISDPMVSVLSEVGKRTGISPFYISFIFAPLASNASEVIASYKYALKKTSQSITISMSALEGKEHRNTDQYSRVHYRTSSLPYCLLYLISLISLFRLISIVTMLTISYSQFLILVF